MNIQLMPNTMERCALCGRMTNVPYSRPISERTRYVVGVGELCPDCCRSLYHVDDLRLLSEPVSL